MGNLKRKQIYIDEESDRALKNLAVATEVSESELIDHGIYPNPLICPFVLFHTGTINPQRIAYMAGRA